MTERTHLKLTLIVTGIFLAIIIAMCVMSSHDLLNNNLTYKLKNRDYAVTEYDRDGNVLFETHGYDIKLKAVVSRNYNRPTAYVNIEIDGETWTHGSTTILFTQEGIEPLPPDANSNNNGQKVLICNNIGTPIYTIYCTNCTVKPATNAELAGVVRLEIDGKYVYIYNGSINVYPQN